MDTEEFYYNWDKIKYIDDISDKDLAYAQKVNHLYKGKLYIRLIILFGLNRC